MFCPRRAVKREPVADCRWKLSLGRGIIGLERRDFKRVASRGLDCTCSCKACCRCCEIGHLARQRCRPDRVAILERLPTFCGVEHQIDVGIEELVNDMGTPLCDFVYELDRQSPRLKIRSC